MSTQTANCGGGLTATWNDTFPGPLTITYDGVGTGVMNDYTSGGAPWYSSRTLLTSLSLPDGITHIGECAFNYCYGFTGSLVIPNSVTSIGNYAFNGCSGFTDVKFMGNQPTLGSSAFELNTSSPAETYDVYSNGWANEETFSEYENTKWNYKTFDNTYVWNGSAWKLGTPYVYTSSGWKQRGGLPCTPAVVGRTDWCRSVI